MDGVLTALAEATLLLKLLTALSCSCLRQRQELPCGGEPGANSLLPPSSVREVS